jgi:hypothetical protein
MIKKTLVCAAAVFCILVAFAFAAETPLKDANQTAVVKQSQAKTAKMNARGKVLIISDKAVTIERSIKGNAEKMEFALEKPVRDIAVNDSVKIDYNVKEGVLTAVRVVKLGAAKTPVKNGANQSQEKPASAAK